MPKEKTPRFRKENRQLQHPERKIFRMETNYRPCLSKVQKSSFPELGVGLLLTKKDEQLTFKKSL
ncbi:MAG: hypothetical protein D5R98_01950 [Desulfonatronovibrio sp. MSAO_Bac4]|nr:MAG: hypothetical protein D5R98_01950 [Desulfonatronovibrio sp. MSAO_Bac4]